MERKTGLEPATYGLEGHRSTNWAISARNAEYIITHVSNRQAEYFPMKKAPAIYLLRIFNANSL